MIRKLVLIIPALVFAFGNKQQYEIDQKAQQIGFSKIFDKYKNGILEPSSLEFNSMVYDDSNNIIIAGAKSGKPIVRKVDVQGNELWRKQYGDDYGGIQYIEKASKNTYILIRNTEDKKNKNSFLTQVLLIDTYGNLKGESLFPLLLDENSKIKQTNDKGFILVSGTNIIKMDANGFKVWHQTYKNLDLNDFIELVNDEYLFVGKKNIDEKKIDKSAHIMRTDSKGNILWNKNYTNINEFQNIIAKPNELILMGNMPLQVTVTKIDQKGNIIWNYIHTASENTFGRDFIENKSGNFVVAGKIYMSSVKSEYLMIFELTNNGELLWNHSYGLSYGSDTANSILEAPDGYIMSGVITPIEHKRNESGFFPSRERGWIFKVNRQGVYSD